MKRPFLSGFAVGLIVLIFSVGLESRFPDKDGPGKETVSFFGLPVFHRPITKDDMAKPSSIPALAVMYGAILLGSVAGGFAAVWVSRGQGGKRDGKAMSE